MRNLLSRIAAFVSWHRRSVGALLAAGAVFLVASGLRAEPPTEPALVAAHALPAGHRLEAGDVALRRLPVEALPRSRLTSADEAVGQTLSVGVSEGTILQPGALATDHTTEPGRAVVPVTVADASLQSLLRPGEALSLVAQGPDGMVVLSDDARVVATPTREEEGSKIAAATTRDTGLILVDVDAADAPLVASMGQTGEVALILGSLEGGKDS